jgi:hypothetical protein
MSFKGLGLAKTLVTTPPNLGWLVAIFGGMVLLIAGLAVQLVQVTLLASTN